MTDTPTPPQHPCPHCRAPLSISTRAGRGETARCPDCGRHSALVDGMLVPAPPVGERGQA
ncbi:hypothetical protein [Deinococcus indicus]|uniref:hypothetical protein n=1 Tax=Deinococcus indicus TaxID=223556 RepID=UPI00174A312F|nr:hypothetical protein [Deinococcus indicus]